MPPILTSLLSGVWGYLTAAAISALMTASATYYVVHTANAVTISNLKLQASQTREIDLSKSLTRLTGFIDQMHSASADYQGTLSDIDNRFGSLEKAMNNATAKPLPRDCKPDAARVSELSAAIAAVNATNSSP